MTANRRRLTLGATLAIIIAISVVAMVKYGRSPSADSQKQLPDALTSASQLNALLPRSAGNLQLHIYPLAGTESSVAPECLQPSAGSTPGPQPAPIPELDYDVNEPVTTASYSTQNYGFGIELFRFSQSKLAQVRQLLKSAPASCTRARLPGVAADVNIKLDLTFGDASAVYQSYVAPALNETNIRTPESIDLIAISGPWGLSVSTTSGNADTGDTIKEASLTAQYLPDLLHRLDIALHTSFWPPQGTVSSLRFPPSTPYLAQGITANSPTFKPSYDMLSGDSSFYLAKLRWSSWSTRAARATGIAGINICTPTCAAGNWRTYPVQATLSKPQYVCGFLFFGRLQLHWLTAKPGTSQDETFSILPSC